MINLRYHIVSITAVFLALGIGLTLGSTFLDRVTVDVLKARLDKVQERVSKAEVANNSLTDRVGSLEDRDGELSLELPERVLAGRLDAVPVLVLATEGTDKALVDETVTALSAAGADVSGTWWLTDQWLLDDHDQAAQLADVLALSTDDAVRLRRNGAIRVAELLADATKAPAVEPAPDPAAIPVVDPAAIAASDPTEPALIARLKAAGFLDYRAPTNPRDAKVLLPGASARYVVVSGAQPDAGSQLFAAALLEEVVASGVAPVVAAQGEVDVREAGVPASEEVRRTTFVGPLRLGELTRDRLSTVDDLDTAAGLAALVLAMEDLSTLQVGHYGTASSAARLLPAARNG